MGVNDVDTVAAFAPEDFHRGLAGKHCDQRLDRRVLPSDLHNSETVLSCFCDLFFHLSFHRSRSRGNKGVFG